MAARSTTKQSRSFIGGILLIASGILPAVQVHTGPKLGEKRDSTFSFSHISDWPASQISNNIQNDHAKGLIVDWPAGGITRGERNPIPSGQSDLNKYSCPVSSLNSDDTAQLFYGLQRTAKTAGAYTCRQAAQSVSLLQSELRLSTLSGRQVAQPVPSLQSELRLSTSSGPFTLEVTSIVAAGQSVNTFKMNRDMHLSFSANDLLAREFANQGWKVTPRALDSVREAEALTFRLGVAGAPNRDSFYLFSPPSREATVKLSARSVTRRTTLFVVMDSERAFVGTGFVSWHVASDAGTRDAGAR